MRFALKLIFILFFSFACSTDSQDYDPIELYLSYGDEIDRKKGVAFGLSSLDSWDYRLNALNAKWHYSWNWELQENYPEDIEFVPMIWGQNSTGPITMDYIASLVDSGDVTHLLGFNEPDLESQANMSVDQAVLQWSRLETTGAVLGSPVTAAPLNSWMTEFMTVASEENLDIDFIAVHWYGPPNPSNFINKINEVFDQYQKPIWITEFAVRDPNATTLENNQYSPEQVLAFMETVLPQLEEMAFVHRYAWFSTSTSNQNYAKTATSVLIDDDNQITPLGEFYANFSED
tara:strand:+ start:1176 stop:2042 length:867 start_codon:yes stop_codon:yes gene_type:complete